MGFISNKSIVYRTKKNATKRLSNELLLPPAGQPLLQRRNQPRKLKKEVWKEKRGNLEK